MKFKIHFLLLAVLLWSSVGLQAQTPDHFHCGIGEGNQNMPLGVFSTPTYSGSVNPLYLSSFPQLTFNIYFWVVKRSDGTADDIVSNQQIIKEMNQINEFFKPMGICFVLGGVGSINNDQLYPKGTDFWSIASYAQNNNYMKSNNFNVYIHPDISNGNGVTNYGLNYIGIDMWVIQGLWSAPKHVLAHELAHTFGLYHAWGNNNGGTYTDERVTRDPNNPNYNALTAGDRVADTPAMVSFNNEAIALGVPLSNILDFDNCLYIGTSTDNLGVPFSLTPADVGNPMQYTHSPCVQSFTTGQGIRIREYISGSPNVLSVQAMRANNSTKTLNTPETNLSFIYQYSSTIITNGNYQTAIGQNINLKAGDYILLESNTDIKGGSVFVAEIEKCDCPSILQKKTSYIEDFANLYENKNAVNLVLYPNPANESITISLDSAINNLTITSIEGFIMYKKEVKNNSADIDVSNYKKGIYIVTIQTNEGEILTEKLIKN
ncbi:zinc-dependent metalloprotease [Flavobacterium cerinum]|uniref:T9SS type A sorting domain-containing protein n=1 Tax=Flavobacterium cerinum TaxID=2502784 RepID=A0A3S3TVD6_9FLAO|nr:zinc-dependent metalloprotease [Flavobacterium cerinum]RWW92087.1 T9SS type A sorting domain-containing protein [Flavobacterium cerinum]